MRNVANVEEIAKRVNYAFDTQARTEKKSERDFIKYGGGLKPWRLNTLTFPPSPPITVKKLSNIFMSSVTISKSYKMFQSFIRPTVPSYLASFHPPFTHSFTF